MKAVESAILAVLRHAFEESVEKVGIVQKNSGGIFL